MKSNIVSHISTDSFLHAIVGDDMVTMTNDHPNWREAIEALKRRDGAELVRLSEPKKVEDVVTAAIAEVFECGAMRIKSTPTGRRLFYKGLMIDNEFAAEVINAYTAGMPVNHYLAFFENLIQNPLESAVAELFEYCKCGRFTITEDGHILAFKRVLENFMDIHSATFDNSPGKICEVPRDSVDPNRDRTCSSGLHFCSYDYLPHYGSSNRSTDKVIIVKINPRDIVAIPSDYNNHKGRTCRYEVLREWVSGRLVDGGIVTPESATALVERVAEREELAQTAMPVVSNTKAHMCLDSIGASVNAFIYWKKEHASVKRDSGRSVSTAASLLFLAPFVYVANVHAGVNRLDRPIKTWNGVSGSLVDIVINVMSSGSGGILSMQELVHLANLLVDSTGKRRIYTTHSFSTKRAAIKNILGRVYSMASEAFMTTTVGNDIITYCNDTIHEADAQKTSGNSAGNKTLLIWEMEKMLRNFYIGLADAGLIDRALEVLATLSGERQ